MVYFCCLATPQANLDLTIYPSNEAVFLLVEGESDIDVIGMICLWNGHQTLGIISVDLNDDGEEEEDVENEDLEEEDMKDEDVEDEEEELEDEDMEDEDLEEEIDDDGMDGDLVDDFLDAEEVDMVDDYLDEDELPQSSVIVEEIKSDEEEEEKKEEKQEEVKETEEKEQEEEKEEEKKPEMTPEEKKREKNRLSIHFFLRSSCLERQRQKESKKRRMEKRLEYVYQVLLLKWSSPFKWSTNSQPWKISWWELEKCQRTATRSLSRIVLFVSSRNRYSSHLPTGEIIEEDHQVTFRVGIQDINSQLDKAIGSMYWYFFFITSHAWRRRTQGSDSSWSLGGYAGGVPFDS